MSNNAKTTFNQRNYDQIHIWVPIGQKEIIAKAARQAGESLNRYVAIAIESALSKDNVEFSKMRLDKYQKIV